MVTGFALMPPSLADMDDDLNVQDARNGLRMAIQIDDRTALAAWAMSYGDQLCAMAEECIEHRVREEAEVDEYPEEEKKSA